MESVKVQNLFSDNKASPLIYQWHHKDSAQFLLHFLDPEYRFKF